MSECVQICLHPSISPLGLYLLRKTDAFWEQTTKHTNGKEWLSNHQGKLPEQP
jgi:hypothetical protein